MTNWDNINSETFIRKLKAGDENAFAELYSIINYALVNFLIKQFENSDITWFDAEEIADDIMLKVPQSILRFDSKRDAKLTTWIFKMAINRARDFLRSRKSDKSQAVSEYLQREKEFKAEANRSQIENTHTALLGLTPDFETEQNTISKEDIIARKAFDALHQRERDIIRMRRVMEYEDIAKIENKTINASRAQHSRAMERLKNLLNAYQKEYQNEQ